MPITKLGLAVGSLLVCIFACGCREPVEPAFFNGTWGPPRGVSGTGNVHIDLARRQFLTSLGASPPGPHELKIEQITPIDGGIRLTLRPMRSGDIDTPSDFTVDWEFRRIAEDKMRFTDDVGDSAVWRRVERENAQRGEKAK